jgi:hypothetical protein
VAGVRERNTSLWLISARRPLTPRVVRTRFPPRAGFFLLSERSSDDSGVLTVLNRYAQI